MNRIDPAEDDCRLLRGGAFYYPVRPNDCHDACCLVYEHRPQFGFRLVRSGGEYEAKANQGPPLGELERSENADGLRSGA